MMNVGEYGIALNINVNFDISGASSLLLSFVRPDNTSFVGTPTAPATDLATPDQGTFAARQYARYVFEEGDLTVPGTYLTRLTYVDSSKRLVSDVTSFDVSP